MPHHLVHLCQYRGRDAVQRAGVSPPSIILVKGSEGLEFGAILAWVQTHLIPDSHCVTVDT